MPVTNILTTSLILNPDDQIAWLESTLGLVDSTEYIITGQYLTVGTTFVFHSTHNITLTNPPVGVPAIDTDIQVDIGLWENPAAQASGPPAAYPYVTADRLIAANLNLDLERNPNTTPPHGNGGGAHRYKEWVDTSTAVPTIRIARQNNATAGIYVAAEWSTMAVFDYSGGRFSPVAGSMTSANLGAYTPQSGELIFNNTVHQLVVGDGMTAGGLPIATSLPDPVTVSHGGTGRTMLAIPAGPNGAYPLLCGNNAAPVVVDPFWGTWGDGSLSAYACGTGGNDPYIWTASGRGTLTAATATQAGDSLGHWSFGGYGATAWSGHQAVFQALAAENWTDTAHGTRFLWATTPIGSTVCASFSMTLSNAGVLNVLGGYQVNGGPIPIASGGTGAAIPSTALINLGAITNITAGTGLSGGGTSGTVTLSLAVPVSVINGGTGATTATGALTSLGAAPINAPNFTGIPTAPTAAVSTNTTQLATTAFVMAQVAASTSGVSSVTAGAGLAGGGTGAVTLNIATAGVTNAMHATMPTMTIKGNNTASAASPVDLTATQAMTLLGAAPLASPTFTGVPAGPTASVGTSTTQLATTAFVQAAFPASTTPPTMNASAVLGTIAAGWARGDHVHPSDTSRAPIANPSFTGNVTLAGNYLYFANATGSVNGSATGPLIYADQSYIIAKLGTSTPAGFVFRSNDGTTNLLAVDSAGNTTIPGNLSAANFQLGGSATGQAGTFGFLNTNGPGIAMYGTASTGAGAITFRGNTYNFQNLSGSLSYAQMDTAGNTTILGTTYAPVFVATGSGAGLQFRDRALSGTWMWYATNNQARLWQSVVGDLVTADTGGALSAGPITSNGTQAALWFQDRGGASNWGWYSTGSIARLFNGSDRFTVDSGGSATIPGSLTLGGSYAVDGAQTVSYQSILVTRCPGTGQFRMANSVSGGYGSMWRNDSTSTYLLVTNNGDYYGLFNGLRPFSCDMATGNVTLGHNVSVGATLYATSNFNMVGWFSNSPYPGGADTGSPLRIWVANGHNNYVQYHVEGTRDWQLGPRSDGVFILNDMTAGAYRVWVDLGGQLYVTSNIRSGVANNTLALGWPDNGWNGVYSYAYLTPSARAGKRDIAEPVTGALDQVMALRPVQFHWVDTEDDSNPLHRGFIADEVREVMGDKFAGYRKDEETGAELLAYNELTAVLWQAVRELSAEVLALKAQGSRA